MKMGSNPKEITEQAKDHEHFKTVGRKGDRGWFSREDAMFCSMKEAASLLLINPFLRLLIFLVLLPLQSV